MSNPVILTVTKVDNYKEGAINVLLPIGGIMAAGTINKLTSGVELIQSNKLLYNGIMFALAAVLQFLPKKYLPEWAKKGVTGIGIYHALALLGDIAANPKVPQFAKKIISDYVPGLSGLNGMRGLGRMGSIEELIAEQAAASASFAPVNRTADVNLSTMPTPVSNLSGFATILN